MGQKTPVSARKPVADIDQPRQHDQTAAWAVTNWFDCFLVQCASADRRGDTPCNRSEFDPFDLQLMGSRMAVFVGSDFLSLTPMDTIIGLLCLGQTRGLLGMLALFLKYPLASAANTGVRNTAANWRERPHRPTTHDISKGAAIQLRKVWQQCVINSFTAVF
ncbi:hypothetical protein CIHG_03537 [Coccidioides immitis H538.4]|uniref:Uncharacterized protein n=1 Tax=Coccidioides immitis H538.4 TaxID=396776 RepID=A0A0J8RMD9_COCIT|nr:hypothetical protein CIHG_03537 [Coccidioides immitis H538.4]